MRKIFLYLAFCFFNLTSTHTHAQTWTPVGSPGFTPTAAGFTSLAIDTGGALYIAYTNGFVEGPVNVMKYNGTSWAAIGSPDFSAGTAQNTSLALDTGGTPYVVYVDYLNGYAATAMKFDGSSWVNVGSPGFSAGQAGGTVMAIDRSGTPYVAYLDFANNKKATVMKFNGSSWVNVGSPAFSDTAVTDIAIAIDNSGTPYVAFNDYYSPQRSTVMKFNGSAWVTVGSPRFSDSAAHGMSIAIDTGGTPYVVYADFSADDGFTGAASVRKFNGSSWVFVGSPGFATPNSYYATIAIDKYGTPYVAFESSTGAASSMKYNGSSWIPVGSLDFSAGGIGWTDIVINRNGIPYVAYSDYVYGNNATVMEFTTPTSPITGIDTVCIGATTTLSDSTIGGTWSSGNVSIATVASGAGVVTGVSTGTVAISYTAFSGTVFTIVTVNLCTTGISPILTRNPSFTLHLTTPQNESAKITITNILGEKVKQLTNTTNTDTQIQLNSPPGIYFISATTKEGSVNEKIVLE